MSAMVAERVIDGSKNLWSRTNGANIDIGFTNQLLEIVRECWHVTPASKEVINTNSPLITVETHDSQFTVNAPVGGYLTYFNDRAMNFPDKLTEEDIICTLAAAKPEPKSKKATPEPRGGHRVVQDENGFWHPARAVEGPDGIMTLQPITLETVEDSRERTERNLVDWDLAAVQMRAGQGTTLDLPPPRTVSTGTSRVNHFDAAAFMRSLAEARAQQANNPQEDTFP